MGTSKAGIGAALQVAGQGLMQYTQYNIEEMRQRNLEAIRQRERGEDMAQRASERAEDKASRESEFSRTLDQQDKMDLWKSLDTSYDKIGAKYGNAFAKLQDRRRALEDSMYDPDTMLSPEDYKKRSAALDQEEARVLALIQEEQNIFARRHSDWATRRGIRFDESTPDAGSDMPSDASGMGTKKPGAGSKSPAAGADSGVDMRPKNPWTPEMLGSKTADGALDALLKKPKTAQSYDNAIEIVKEAYGEDAITPELEAKYQKAFQDAGIPKTTKQIAIGKDGVPVRTDSFAGFAGTTPALPSILRQAGVGKDQGVKFVDPPNGGWPVREAPNENVPGKGKVYKGKVDRGIMELPTANEAAKGPEKEGEPMWIPKEEADTIIKSVADTAKVPFEHLRRMFHTESGDGKGQKLDAHAVSGAGAKGVGQLTPIAVKEAERLKILPENFNIWDPRQNAEVSAKLYASLLERYGGDDKKATAAYNMGPTALDSLINGSKDRPGYGEKWMSAPRLPMETYKYLVKIFGKDAIPERRRPGSLG